MNSEHRNPIPKIILTNLTQRREMHAAGIRARGAIVTQEKVREFRSNRMNSAHVPTARLEWIDGLRAISILLVMMFHYYARWTPPLNSTSLYPYGSTYASFPPIMYGAMGVRLFFIISGFVIAYSLTRSSNILDFAARRYSRLFPAMFFCATITFVSAYALPYALSSPTIIDALPSITFIEPGILNRIFRTSLIDSIDGSYWSLYVEVKFYAIIGMAYFIYRDGMPIAICFISAFAVSIFCMDNSASGPIENILFAKSWPWFVMGVGIYLFNSTSRPKIGWLLATIALVELLALSLHDRDWVPICFGCGALAIFYLGLKSRALQAALSLRALSLIGLASYPLYLLHQNLGVQLIRLLGESAPNSQWSGLVPILVSALMICAAIAIHMLVERPIQRMLSRPLARLSALSASRRQQ